MQMNGTNVNALPHAAHVGPVFVDERSTGTVHSINLRFLSAFGHYGQRQIAPHVRAPQLIIHHIALGEEKRKSQKNCVTRRSLATTKAPSVIMITAAKRLP